MKKRIFLQIIAVLTAISMLPSTALAASFEDLQDAIDGNNGTLIEEGSNRYGYGWNDTENRYGIEAWDDEEGNRNVQLKEDVTVEDKEDGVTVGAEDGNVTIDLNGNDIASDNYDPNVGTAANGTPGEGGEYGSVITVGKDANLTITDTSSENTEEQGTISGGFGIYDGGGGVLVDGGSLTLEGGNISDNASYRGGGGVGVKNDGQATMNGGAISEKDRKSVV